MEFNQEVHYKLDLIFQEYNLLIVEEYENYLRLKSPHLTIIIGYSPIENSGILYIGRSSGNSEMVEVNNDVMKEFFNSDLHLSSLTTEIFLNNLVLFFKREGKALFEGDLNTIIELENYYKKKNTAYTRNLIDQQNLESANHAWNQENYKEFIRYLEKINFETLPNSYKLKYKIAFKNLRR